MKVQEIADSLKAKLEAKRSEIDGDLDLISQITTSLQEETLEAEKKGYDQAVVDMGGVNGTDKIYSQEQFDKYVAEEKAVWDAKFNEVSEKVSGLEEQVAAAPAEKEAALAALKKDVAAKIRNANIDDAAIADELDAPAAPVEE